MPKLPPRAALAAVLAVLAGCGTRPFRGEEGAPKAVVLSTAARAEDSERVARALNERGYDVLRKSTPIARDRSSAAVYGVRTSPDRVDELTDLLKELGVRAEVLPFQQHATGGNAVVVWLGEDSGSD